MMQPYKVEIYLYAESETEVKDAQQAAYEFVNYNYMRGNIVTASKFAQTLRRFKNNSLVTSFLRQ